MCWMHFYGSATRLCNMANLDSVFPIFCLDLLYTQRKSENPLLQRNLCIIMAFIVSTRTGRSSIVKSSQTNIAIADRLILLSKLCVFAFWRSVEGWTTIDAKDAHNMLNGNPESIISLVHLIGDGPSHRAREHKCLIFCYKYPALEG